VALINFLRQVGETQAAFKAAQDAMATLPSDPRVLLKDLEGTTTSLAQSGQTLEAGQSYRWSVEAFDTSGTQISHSPSGLAPFVFR